jgi:metal-responsive CopG/Arc/MetJ family transcriptional regulator
LNLWKNQLMPVRVTIEIPQTLQEELRKRAESTGTSMRSLIVRAIESRTPGCQG